MNLVVKEVKQFEITVGGELVWRVQTPVFMATANQPSHGFETNVLVAEGVRRAVDEYGEVMRRLTNEKKVKPFV